MYRSPPCAEGVGRYLKYLNNNFQKLIGVTTCNIAGMLFWLYTNTNNMDIIKLNKPISYWKNNNDNNVVYILYRSHTTWNKTMLGTIRLLSDSSLKIYSGSNEEDRKIISSFITESEKRKSGSYSRIDDEGKDNLLMKDIHDIVVNVINHNPLDYEAKLLLLHIESDNYKYEYRDVRSLSSYEIVEMNEPKRFIYFKHGDLVKSFYCGITNDVDIRMDQHRKSDFSIVDDYVCANVEIAKQVEGAMGELGYDIGGKNEAGNGATDYSCIVYFLKKGKSV